MSLAPRPSARNDAALLRILKQALPYIRQHKKQVMVVKLGGELAGNPHALRSLAEDISLLVHVGIRLVVVHGGGPQATEMSRRLGITPQMVEGRRVTDEQTLDVAKMVFAGKINTDILSALRGQGVRAVGLSGVDADIVSAVRRKPTEMRDEATGGTRMVDFGHVGDVHAVDSSLLSLLMDNGYVPVLASLGADEQGAILNINADTVASVLARDLGAAKLISLTAVPGVLRDKDDPSSLVPLLSTRQAREMLAGGAVGGGMRPKIQAVVDAVEAGVRRGHILSGLARGSILLELFTREGCGTLIVGENEAAEAAADAAAAAAAEATATSTQAGRLPMSTRAVGRPPMPDERQPGRTPS
ncbi:MAG: acetylglutamate kinase [Planctomycetota bacterium]